MKKIQIPFLSNILQLFIFSVVLALPNTVFGNNLNTDLVLAKNDTLTPDGAWCWFADPRAIYYKGIKEQTYFSWITKNGDVEIASYNHRTQEYIKKTLFSKLEVDDHDNPTLFFREDGRLIVFFSKHNGITMHRVISQNPEDITSWGSDYLFGVNVTYPYPFKMDNQIGLFYRGLNWHPTLVTSSDNGLTFGTPQQFIQGGGGRPYTKYCQDKNGAIHIAFTDGHPRDLATKIFYVCYKNGKFYRANGTYIKDFTGTSTALNIDTNEAEIVYDASNGKGWIWDITTDADGYPVLVYATFPTDTDHRYSHARWNGTAWVKTPLTKAGKWFPQTPVNQTEREPNYSGGISLDADNPSVVYLSKQVNGVFEIFKWTTNDKGATWDSLAITQNTPAGLLNVRPIVPRNHKPGLFDVLWMKGTYIHYTNYNTSILFQNAVETPLDSIKLDTDSVHLYKGNNKQLNVTFLPFFASNKTIVWSSGNANVATVMNGNIVSTGVGSTTITATLANGFSATCKVKVEEFIPLSTTLFDFGLSTSPVMAGAIQITESTALNSSYGWLSTAGILPRDRVTSTDELRDFVLSPTAATFRVFVQNGTFHVTIKQGDVSYAHDNMGIAVNGINKASVTSGLNSFVTTVFDVSTNNNVLDFTFTDGGGSDVNWVLNSLKLEQTLLSAVNDISEEDLERNATISIYDITGKMISEEKHSGRVFYNVFKNSNFKSGMYILKIKGTQNSKTIKYIKS